MLGGIFEFPQETHGQAHLSFVPRLKINTFTNTSNKLGMKESF